MNDIHGSFAISHPPGPRKSIDQLWDEVYDYRRKLQQEQLALAQSLPVHASGAMSFLNMVAAGSNHQDHPSAHLSPDDGYFGDDSFRPAFRNRANSSSSVTGRRPFQRSAPRRRNTLNGGPTSVSHSYAPSSSLSGSNAFSRHRYNSWSEYDDVHHQGHHHHSSSSSSSSSRGDFYDLPVVEECRDDEIEDEEEDMNDDEYTEQEYNGHAHSHVALALDDEMDVEHALNSSGPSGSTMAGLLLDDTMVSLEDYYSSLATSLTSLTSQSEGQQQQLQQQPSADPRSRSSSIFSSKDASSFPLKKRGGAGPGSALASHAHSPSSIPPPPSLALKIQPTSPRTLPFVPNLPVLSLPSSSQAPLSPCTMSPSPTTSSTTPPLASPSASSEYAFYAALSSSLSSLACTCGGPFGNTPTLTTSPFFSLPPTPTSPSYLAHHSNGPDHEPSCPLHWQQTARLDPTNVFANKNRARVEPGAAMGLLRSYLIQSGTSDRKHTRGTGGLKAATYGYHKQQQHQPVKSKRLSLPFF
ncbi:hypothetical protein BGW42_003155 [Actinomortierella wolfii]|nr:hypothetical protein BGW42_003155 [Actinomortierella wolfii]